MSGSEPGSAPAAGSGYRLAAAGREAAEDERLDLLEQIYDPTSRRRRSLLEPGWRCLEVGAGRGSMAVWLAEQVGPTGHVVATDLDTRQLSRLDLPNLEVVEHNILDDPLDALGAGSFDLVCSRLMLFHLQNPRSRRSGRWPRAWRRVAGSSTRTPPGGLPGPRSILRIRATTTTSRCGTTATGGRIAATTSGSARSCRPSSSAAASRRSATRRRARDPRRLALGEVVDPDPGGRRRARRSDRRVPA
jgi:SAM-dependent methyltransferase